MNSSDQPSPDRPQITQLDHSPRNIPTSPLKSSLPSPQIKPSFSFSTPLNPSYTSSPLSPISSCSHVEPGNYCLDCLDSPKNSPQMDPNYLVPSPSTALSSEFTEMSIRSPSAAMSQKYHPSECSTCSNKSPRPPLPYSPESSSYSPEAHPDEQASSILRDRHSSNSSHPFPAPSPLQPLHNRNVAPNRSQTRYEDYENTDYYEDQHGYLECPDNFGINLDDTQLLCISTMELNKRLRRKTLTKDEKQKLKQKRRTLKNRGYAFNCRVKKDEEANNLVNDVEDLEKRADSVDAEYDKKQKLLREVQHNFKRAFEWADNNAEIDVHRHLETYRKLI